MDRYDLLPPQLRNSAYKTGSELAWKREDALKVVALLEEQGFEVIGVDTWIPTLPGPTPLIDDWSRDRARLDPNTNSASEFISVFQHDRVGRFPAPVDVVFNLVAILR